MKTKGNRKCELNLVKREGEIREYSDVRKNLKNNVKKSVWSKWLNYIRGYWCIQAKAKESTSVYAGELSSEVSGVPTRCSSISSKAKAEIPESPPNELVHPENKFYNTLEKDKNSHRNQRHERLGGEFDYFVGGRNLSSSKLHSRWNKIQNQQFAVLTSGSSSGDSRSCDQFSGVSATECKQAKENKKVKFETEFAKAKKKGFPRKEKSNQVSPEILVNIKPFKRRLKKLDLNQSPDNVEAKENESVRRKADNLKSGMSRRESRSYKFGYNAPKNKPSRSLSNTGETKPSLQNVPPTKSLSVQSSLNHLISNVKHKNSGKVSLDEVLDNVDDRNHNVVFKRNITQFRKRIMQGNEGEEELEEEEWEEEVEELIKKELKPENYMEARAEMITLTTEKVLQIFKGKPVVLGINYKLVDEFNILKTAFVTKEIHFLTISQAAREIYLFHGSYFRTEVEKRHPSMSKLLFREILKIQTQSVLNEISVQNKVSIVYSDPCDCLADIQLRQIDPKGDTNNVMDFLQEYSELAEEGYSCHEFVEKIFSTVEENFSSFRLAEVRNKIEAANVTVAEKHLEESHGVVQILNDPVPEYITLIYQKPVLEFYFREDSLQAITASSDVSLTDEFFRYDIREDQLTRAASFDSLQILYSGKETDHGYETPQYCDSGSGKITLEENERNSLSTLVDDKKVLMFKCYSFPREAVAVNNFSSQRLHSFKDPQKDFRKKRKPVEKGFDIISRVNSVQFDSEKPVAVKSDIVHLKDVSLLDEFKGLMASKSKKMIFTKKNPGKLGKEIIAAFSSIKDLNEDISKKSVVIMLSKK